MLKVGNTVLLHVKSDLPWRREFAFVVTVCIFSNIALLFILGCRQSCSFMSTSGITVFPRPGILPQNRRARCCAENHEASIRTGSEIHIPSYVISDCVWHCSRVFKHPVHAVVARHLERLKNSIELEEQTTRSIFIIQAFAGRVDQT